mmetsp:Transcript_7735/g.20247  ORF Transcript_7735/g.20247 Transcript_7735/m.20247 type:complete len:123 (-) Transcript_7735:24-392(-)
MTSTPANPFASSPRVLNFVQVFEITASVILRRSHNRVDLPDRRFKALFGASATVVATLWIMILTKAQTIGAGPKHLLWALHFLKVYSVEDVSAEVVGTDPKTWRKWVWRMVDLMHGLDIVSN